ncbi:MAG: ATP-binding cassette domain-containing protein [Thermoleophilia bacterium]|nr:ATP-binding cassette domain-containing protein [Thermoleophilia bacterium]
MGRVRTGAQKGGGLQAAAAKLAVEGLSKTYRGAGGGEHVIALRDVSIEIGDGDFVSIVGPSWCGKSTLFNIVAGLVSEAAPGPNQFPAGSSPVRPGHRRRRCAR